MYGVVTMPFSVREGINVFLEGRLPTENLRFREDALTFKITDQGEEFASEDRNSYSYPAMTKTQETGGFKLTVNAGHLSNSQIVVMLGENGTGM